MSLSLNGRGTRLTLLTVLAALLASGAIAAPVAAADNAPWGYRVQRGAELRDYRVPVDMRLIGSRTDPRTGLVFERYQQFAAPLDVLVDGSQLAVVRRDGEPVLTIGNHYPGLRVQLRPTVAAAAASAIAARNVGRVAGVRLDPSALVTRHTQLRLDPETRQLFHLVESAAPGVRVLHQIDAVTGDIIDAWDALHTAEPGMGTGVKLDRKSLRGALQTADDDLTTRNRAGKWVMQSRDSIGRYVTLDADDGLVPLRDATSGGDNDNDWNAKYERAAVDAQYYAKLSSDFFVDRFNFDVLDPGLTWPTPADFWCQFDRIESVVHEGSQYDNAYWDGASLYYGDGDGLWTTALSGAQDVVTHEFGHAVTECRVPLDYKDEAGALNESFSDIVATAAEWATAEPLSSNCRLFAGQTDCPDWWIGEDVVLDGAPFHAFRNLATPGVEDQPSHYSQRYTGTDDSGGVHTNSGIANHAFYLMVEGGRNARCVASAAAADCDVVVPEIGMAHAEQIVFTAWGDLLTTNARFCAARDATVEAARLLYPGSADVGGVDLAWRAVGVSACGGPRFSIVPSERTILVGPGGIDQVTVTLRRPGGLTSPIDVTVSSPAAISATLSDPPTMDTTGDVVQLLLDAGAAPSGSYPVSVFATGEYAGPDGPEEMTAATSVLLVVDRDPPTPTVDSLRIAAGATVADGQLPLVLDWSATDELSGVASGSVERSTAADTWQQIAATPTGSAGLTLPGGEHSFRALAADGVGNAGESAPFVRVVGGVQESAVTYAGAWSVAPSVPQWGTVRFSKTPGASASLTFTGTDVAWVAQKGPKRGRAWVYLDDVQVAAVDLYAARLRERRVVFATSGLAAGAHTLRVVVRRTTDRPRVDVDGFIVVAPAP
jgi:Zn-dependent metalloprotease